MSKEQWLLAAFSLEFDSKIVQPACWQDREQVVIDMTGLNYLCRGIRGETYFSCIEGVVGKDVSLNVK